MTVKSFKVTDGCIYDTTTFRLEDVVYTSKIEKTIKKSPELQFFVGLSSGARLEVEEAVYEKACKYLNK